MTLNPVERNETVKSQQELQDFFDSNFAFAIGDAVMPRATDIRMAAESAVNGPLESYNRVGTPECFIVTERRLQQCHGGVQAHYQCGTGANAGWFVEFELLPFAAAVERMKESKATAREVGE